MTESNIQFSDTEFSSDSPLALPFEQALQPSVFLTRLKQSAESQARREFGDLGNDALKAGIAAAKFVLDKKGVKVVFEGGIPKGAKFMKDAAGKYLPKLVDGKTGRVLKTGRNASTVGKVAELSASAALVVVEAAHLISGHDNAKRLKKVERAASVPWLWRFIQCSGAAPNRKCQVSWSPAHTSSRLLSIQELPQSGSQGDGTMGFPLHRVGIKVRSNPKSERVDIKAPLIYLEIWQQ